MSNSVLYVANTTTQTLAATDPISFGNVIRRCGNNIKSDGVNVVVSSSGYYDVDTNFTFIGSTGTTTITLYKDGVRIPGATVTLTTVATVEYTVSIPAIVRQSCCCDSVITAVLSGSAATFSNAAMTISKI